MMNEKSGLLPNVGGSLVMNDMEKNLRESMPLSWFLLGRSAIRSTSSLFPGEGWGSDSLQVCLRMV